MDVQGGGQPADEPLGAVGLAEVVDLVEDLALESGGAHELGVVFLRQGAVEHQPVRRLVADRQQGYSEPGGRGAQFGGDGEVVGRLGHGHSRGLGTLEACQGTGQKDRLAQSRVVVLDDDQMTVDQGRFEVAARDQGEDAFQWPVAVRRGAILYEAQPCVGHTGREMQCGQPDLPAAGACSYALNRVPVRLPPRPSAAELLRIDQDALHKAAGPWIALDLAWSTTDLARLIVGELHEAFGRPAPAFELPLRTEVRLGLPAGPLSIELRIKHAAGMGAPLSVDTTVKNPHDRRTLASAPRRMQTAAWFERPGTEGIARFALVEMPGADDFPNAEHDPKHPVKAAAAEAGVLVQNLTPPRNGPAEDKDEQAGAQRERVRKSILDLLVRQNGLLATPSFLGTAATPLTDITAVGLWIVRRNREARARLPLAVVQLPGEPFVRMRTPHTPWLPYREALLTLADYQAERTFKDENVRDFYGEVISDICDGSDIALLTVAQNIRSSCPGMGNAHLIPDTLAFDPEQPVPAQTWKGLRHIRLRTNLRDETSQHYAFQSTATERGLVGVGSGLWSDPGNPRLFFSTARKPATAAAGSPQGSRIEAHWGRTGTEDDQPVFGWKHDTTKNVWNPQLVELLVACHGDSDDVTAWAALAHQLRYSSRHHSDPLLLPGVLHMASLVAKHILPRHLIEEISQGDS